MTSERYKDLIYRKVRANPRLTAKKKKKFKVEAVQLVSGGVSLVKGCNKSRTRLRSFTLIYKLQLTFTLVVGFMKVGSSFCLTIFLITRFLIFAGHRKWPLFPDTFILVIQNQLIFKVEWVILVILVIQNRKHDIKNFFKFILNLSLTLPDPDLGHRALDYAP